MFLASTTKIVILHCLIQHFPSLSSFIIKRLNVVVIVIVVYSFYILFKNYFAFEEKFGVHLSMHF